MADEKREHTSMVASVSIVIRDRQTFSNEKDGKTSHFISFFTDAQNVIGFVVTIDKDNYRLFKSEEMKYGYRVLGVKI